MLKECSLQKIHALNCKYTQKAFLSIDVIRKICYYLVAHNLEYEKVAVLGYQGSGEVLKKAFSQVLPKDIGIKFMDIPNYTHCYRRCSGPEQTQFDYPLSCVIISTSPDLYLLLMRFCKNHLSGNPDIVLPFLGKNSDGVIESTFDDTPLAKPKIIVAFPGSGSKKLEPQFASLMSFFNIPYDYNIREPHRDLRTLNKILPKVSHSLFSRKRDLLSQEAIDEYYYDYLKRYPSSYKYGLVHHPLSTNALLSSKDAQIIYLIRDPRDMITTIFHRITHHCIIHEFEDFRKLSKEEGLLTFINGYDYLRKDYFLKWPPLKKICKDFLLAYKNENIYVLRYEDICYTPAPTYRKLLSWMGFDKIPLFCISDHMLNFAIHQKTSNKQTCLKKEIGLPSQNHSVNSREDSCGEWKNHYSPHLCKIVKELVGEELIELGYEKNMDW